MDFYKNKNKDMIILVHFKTLAWHITVAPLNFPSHITRASSSRQHTDYNRISICMRCLWVIPKIMRQMCYKMAQKSNISDTSQQNKFPACNIFELPHYFWNDPYMLWVVHFVIPSSHPGNPCICKFYCMLVEVLATCDGNWVIQL